MPTRQPNGPQGQGNTPQNNQPTPQQGQGNGPQNNQPAQPGQGNSPQNNQTTPQQGQGNSKLQNFSNKVTQINDSIKNVEEIGKTAKKVINVVDGFTKTPVNIVKRSVGLDK